VRERERETENGGEEKDSTLPSATNCPMIYPTPMVCQLLHLPIPLTYLHHFSTQAPAERGTAMGFASATLHHLATWVSHFME